MFEFKVFIGHSNSPEDLQFMRKLEAALKRIDGITVYIAEDDRQPGIDLTEKIKANILSSNAVVGIWTGPAKNSPMFNHEMQFAADNGRPPKLLAVKGVPIEGFLVGKQVIFFDPKEPVEGIMDMAFHLQIKKNEHGETITTATLISVIIGIILIIALFYYLSKK